MISSSETDDLLTLAIQLNYIQHNLPDKVYFIGLMYKGFSLLKFKSKIHFGLLRRIVNLKRTEYSLLGSSYTISQRIKKDCIK